MSGGSWDYIQSALDCGEFVSAEKLKRFAERAKTLHPDADAAIHRRLETMIELAEQYERTFKSLVEVFGLVDYLDSGDYGADQVLPALRWFPEKPPACEICGREGMEIGDPCVYRDYAGSRWVRGRVVVGGCPGRCAQRP